MAAEGKKVENLDLLEEDDEFEEFAEDDWDIRQEDQTDIQVCLNEYCLVSYIISLIYAGDRCGRKVGMMRTPTPSSRGSCGLSWRPRPGPGRARSKSDALLLLLQSL